MSEEKDRQTAAEGGGERDEKLLLAADLLLERVIDALSGSERMDGRELSAISTALKGAKEVRAAGQKARSAAEKDGADGAAACLRVEFSAEAEEAAV